jgi:hypothetical protein
MCLWGGFVEEHQEKWETFSNFARFEMGMRLGHNSSMICGAGIRF